MPMDVLLATAPEFYPYVGTLARQHERQREEVLAQQQHQQRRQEQLIALRNAAAATGAVVATEALEEGSSESGLIEMVGGRAGPSIPASAPPKTYFQWLYTSYLGGGSYGKTWLAYEQATGNYAAVKLIPLLSDHRRDLVMREIQLMTLASRHFSFPQLFQKETIDNYALLFMEYCDAGDLHQEIARRSASGFGFTEHHVRMIVAQLLIGVNHLHRQGYIHRDLKTSNVLLTRRGLVKIADFGLARCAIVATTYCGTPEYMAPEIWVCSTYDSKIDIWALGVILYELLTLQRPFVRPRGDSDEGGATTESQANSDAPSPEPSLRDQILDNAFPRLNTFPHMAHTFSQALADTCESMLMSDPEQRPTASWLLEQPYWRAAVEELLSAMSSSTDPHMVADMNRVYWCLAHDGIIQPPSLPSPNRRAQQQHADAASPTAVATIINNTAVTPERMPAAKATAAVDDDVCSESGAASECDGMPSFPEFVEAEIDPGVADLENVTRQLIEGRRRGSEHSNSVVGPTATSTALSPNLATSTANDPPLTVKKAAVPPAVAVPPRGAIISGGVNNNTMKLTVVKPPTSPGHTHQQAQSLALAPWVAAFLTTEEARSRREAIELPWTDQLELMIVAEKASRAAQLAALSVPSAQMPRPPASASFVSPQFATTNSFSSSTRRAARDSDRPLTLGNHPLDSPLTGRLLPRQLGPASPSSQVLLPTRAAADHHGHHPRGEAEGVPSPQPPSDAKTSSGGGRRSTSTIFR